MRNWNGHVCLQAFVMIGFWHNGQALRLLQEFQTPTDTLGYDPALTADLNFAKSFSNSEHFDKEIRDMVKQFVDNTGGAARILLVGDSTVGGLYAALRTRLQGLSGLTIDFVRHDHCLDETLYAKLLQVPTAAVLWNFGLHLLHSHPVRRCDGDGVNVNCGPYKDVLTNSSRFLAQHAPSARLVWKTTNSICEEKFTTKYLTNVQEWHDPTTSKQLESQCRAECPQRFGSGERLCVDEVFDHRSTKLQHDASLGVIKSLPFKVHVVDAFKITDGHCEVTAEKDGRHYPTLDEAVAFAFAQILKQPADA